MPNAQSYDNPLRVTYQFLAAAIDAAAIFGRFQGPRGLKGRCVSIHYHVVNTTTDDVTEITLDTAAGLTALTLPICVIPIRTGALGGADTVADDLPGKADLPADTIIEVTSDGGCTAGDADVYVTVDWF